MEVKNNCVYCDYAFGDEICDSKDKTFAELVNDCKIKHQNYEIEDEELDKPGILKWLLTNVSQKVIDPLNIDNIVDQCMFSSEGDMIQILKENEVFVNISLECENNPYKIRKERILSYAAKYGNSKIISWLLKLQINEEIKGNNLSPMLLDAIVAGKLNNVKIFVNRGADIKIPLGSLGESALEVAAKNGHVHIIQWMFNNNMFNKNCFKGSFTNTLERALYKALTNSHYHVVEYIVENTKVDLNYVIDIACGGTVIHVAANLNNVNIVKFLVQNGANLFAKDYSGKTIAHIAAEMGNLNMLKWISMQNSEFKKVEYNPTLLHKAALNGHYDCVEYLVHKNYDIKSSDENNETVLHYAVQSGNVTIVKFLIAHGVDVNISKNYQKKLILNAYRSLEMLQLFASLGFDLNARTYDKDNVLSLAARCNNYDAVQWLLEQGMNVTEVVKYTSYWLDKTCVDNYRLLHLCIKYMKKAKLEFESTNLHIAVLHPEALKIMLEHNYGVNCVLGELGGKLLIDSLHPKLSGRSIEAAYYLLDHGADITVKDKDGKTALYNAIYNTDMQLIKKLVELGSDINTQTYLGDNILGRAIMTNKIEIVKYIVEMGANIHTRNYKGNNVINTASSFGNWEIVKYLVKLGVSINNYSTTCYPVLYVAIDSSDFNVELITWLLEHGAQPNNTPRGRDPILHEIMPLEDENMKLVLLKLLIEHGANVNSLDTNGGTILFSCLNNLKLVKYLIEVGININVQRDDTYTALHTLLESVEFNNNTQNRIKVALKLLNHGADVNIVTERDETPLHIAVRYSHCYEIVKKLIEKGSDVNARDNFGNTVLHLARDINIAMLLIKNGADVNVKCNDGLTVLEIVIKNALTKVTIKSNIVSYIQSCIISNASNGIHSIADHYVNSILYSRYMDYIDFLTSIADIDNAKIMKTVSDFAIHHDNVSIMETLFKRGENILTKSNEGNTVLHLAAAKGSLNIVNYILDHMKHELLLKGNNANETPLHLAINSNNTNIVKLLIKHGVDVNHTTNEGITALHIACKNNGNLELVKLLLEHNADINAQSYNSSSPISMAVQYCNVEVFEFIMNTLHSTEIERTKLIKWKNGKDQTLLHIAAQSRKLRICTTHSTKIMQYLLNSNVISIDAIDKLGNSALHYSCCAHVIESVKLLVENGANVNLKNKTGNTPLHYAAKIGKKDIVEYLIQSGANIKASNQEGNNSIHMAVAHNRINLVSVLIKNPEDIYIKNRKGNCILHQAAACRGLNNILYELTCKYEPLNLNVTNHKNETPLYIAVKFSINNNIHMCLTEEVVNIANVHGQTPLHVHLSQRSRDEMDDDDLLLKFISYGADLTLPNKLGKTPMDLAFTNSHDLTVLI